MKRRLRAAAADIIGAQARSSCDYVLIARPATAIRPYDALCADLRWCLSKMAYLQER